MFLKRNIVEKKPVHNNRMTDNPFLDRILQNRGVTDASAIQYDIKNILSPWGLKDIHEAVDCIIKHIKLNSKIVIVGDYDCDGATSSSIAVEGLEMCGAKNVEYVVPDRQKHGYGLTPSIVNDLKHLEPDLIITVDNGISSIEGALAVKAINCEIVITDHHLAPDGPLPEAEAIVNPNRKDCEFESKNIAGCGVIFYVIMALRSKMRDQGDFNLLGIPNPNIKSLMDLLALGTVADLVTLDENNRNLVSIGLDIIRRGAARPGIMALISVSGKDHKLLTATDFGFALAPRINAAGRMSDMSIGINCLLSRNYEEALQYARELNQLNIDRKETQKSMMEQAEEATNIESDKDGIVVFDESWHEGVIGILASQIKEKLNRPVICFTTCEPEDGRNLVKGSARSVKGTHLKHLLAEIDVKHPHIIKKFGGHAMAAGLSIYQEHLDEFCDVFNKYVSESLIDEVRSGVFSTDIDEPPVRALTLRNAKVIESFGPWGQNFELPIFSGTFDIIGWKIVGEKHLKVNLRKEGAEFEGIAFNCIDENEGTNPFTGRVKIIFKLDVNRFRDEKLQFLIDYIELVDTEIATNSNIERSFTKEGAGKTSRNLTDACKLFQR
ncbi:single-stranded-DNA-specific exonuclease RecJ [Pseudoalteromonas sp. OFAV1]|jgi:single-stranded-DNA-specific exonuclease|uniref:single-stranded-DNA-specific exonuclease RecJ n=1 Tax=Pseudoalteromonas sp. OFAV1 TaxID=2908892 RepID=UPI001F1C4DAC|nr:single-stranded-DNA-specific exonuclease RecJ [Pseudoalteromonas sp. OFAV1]MCF2900951.1 single-stranded-DNA-specific exonuclease RecJ [Pseudoalteromonas sp. OFAV1]